MSPTVTNLNLVFGILKLNEIEEKIYKNLSG